MSTRQCYLLNLVQGVVVLCVTEIVLALPVRAQNQDSLYEVIDVGPWATPRFSGTPRVNNRGQVAGNQGHAFLWENGVIQDLGTLPGGPKSEVSGINDQGQVVGFSNINNNPRLTHAFLWENGVMQDLGTLFISEGDGYSEAHGINDQGEVVGWSYVEVRGQGGSVGLLIRAFLWRAGGIQDLGTLAGPDNVYAFSSARDINDRSQVVGTSNTPSAADPFVGPEHAFLWENGMMKDLGTLGGDTSNAFAINNRGQVVGISLTADRQSHAFLWENGVMQDLGTLGGIESVAEAINDLGQVVGWSNTADGGFHAFLWENGVMKDLDSLIDIDRNSTFWGGFVRATGINNRGEIVGLGYRGDRRTFLSRRLCRDTDGNGNPDNDGDGLCDNWETDGIDVDGDGIVDLKLYDVNQDGVIDANEQADLNHKDLYVEIDWMALHEPLDAALRKVAIAFDLAGIRLHLQTDEEAVIHSGELAFGNQQGFPHFDQVKGQHFGTAKERGSSDSAKLLKAKRLVFRYALFTHTQVGDTSSGIAERPGNDFDISLGGNFAEIDGHPRGNVNEQAGSFMHELGHTLNLQHGGIDNINCKPNYLSVMNYSFQLDGNPFVGRPLDYSRVELATLDESSLNEPAGVGAPLGYKTVYGPPPLQVVRADEPIDWNRDGDKIDNPVVPPVDINKKSTDPKDDCDGRGTVLQGFNDWANLLYDFRGSPDFADGVHATVSPDTPELTFEEAL